jgi:hypothetical protein
MKNNETNVSVNNSSSAQAEKKLNERLFKEVDKLFEFGGLSMLTELMNELMSSFLASVENDFNEEPIDATNSYSLIRNKIFTSGYLINNLTEIFETYVILKELKNHGKIN